MPRNPLSSFTRQHLRTVQFVGGTLAAITAVATTLAILWPTEGRHIVGLVFLYSESHLPVSHARVSVAGIDGDRATTADGDIAFKLSRSVTRLQGIIYAPRATEFLIDLEPNKRYYLIEIGTNSSVPPSLKK